MAGKIKTEKHRMFEEVARDIGKNALKPLNEDSIIFSLHGSGLNENLQDKIEDLVVTYSEKRYNATSLEQKDELAVEVRTGISDLLKKEGVKGKELETAYKSIQGIVDKAEVDMLRDIAEDYVELQKLKNDTFVKTFPKVVESIDIILKGFEDINKASEVGKSPAEMRAEVDKNVDTLYARNEALLKRFDEIGSGRVGIMNDIEKNSQKTILQSLKKVLKSIKNTFLGKQKVPKIVKEGKEFKLAKPAKGLEVALTTPAYKHNLFAEDHKGAGAKFQDRLKKMRENRGSKKGMRR